MRAGWMNGRIDYYCPRDEFRTDYCDRWCLPLRLELAQLDRALWKHWRRLTSQRRKALRSSLATDASVWYPRSVVRTRQKSESGPAANGVSGN